MKKRESIIFFLVFVVLIIVIKVTFNKKDKQIIDNCIYSSASITKVYKYGEIAKGGKYGVGTSPEAVDFYYDFQGKRYYDRCNIGKHKEKVEEGNKYFMLVEKNESKKYIVLFDYPIKDSTDFNSYVKEFEQKRKNQK